MALEFARALVAWRRANQIKQSALAAQLGVSQQALSAWERGVSAPSPAMFARVKSMIARGDPLSLELAFIRRQAAMRAIFDTDGVRLLGYSEGFEKIWQPFCALKGQSLRDELVNEVQALMEDSDLRRQMASGDLAVVSGVSDRHVGIDLGAAFRHRWHVCFRRHGQRTIADMAYEPCDSTQRVGIDMMLRTDEIAD